MDDPAQGSQRRIATDGLPYTHAEFLGHYGAEGENKWQHAVETWPRRASWGGPNTNSPAPFNRPRIEGEDPHPAKRQREWGPPSNNAVVQNKCSNKHPCKLKRPDWTLCSKNQPCRGLPGGATISKDKHPNDPTCTKKSPCKRNPALTRKGVRVMCSKSNHCGKLRPHSTEDEAPQGSETDSDDRDSNMHHVNGDY